MYTTCCKTCSVIPSLPFGPSVQLHLVFGSKWLIIELRSLGFSISYSEVHIYKQSVVQNENYIVSQYLPGSFTQWVTNNIDHNIETLDGQGIFDGMGTLATSTSIKGEYRSLFC